MNKNINNNYLDKIIQLARSGQLSQATAAIQQALQNAKANTSDLNVNLDQNNLLGQNSKLSEWLNTQQEIAPKRAKIEYPAGAQFLARRYDSHHGSRDYKLYVPSYFAKQNVNQQDWPLVIMLHGCTQDPDDFALGTRMNQLAERFNCLVAYPAQSPNANNNKCWNWFQTTDQQRDQGEPAIIAGLTRSLIEEYAIDQSRVYIAGLSAGGAMAALMGLNYPELFAAVGVHSGLAGGSASDITSAFQAMRQGCDNPSLAIHSTPAQLPRLLIFHGDQDTTVNPVNGKKLIKQWQSHSSPQQYLYREEKNVRYTCQQYIDEQGSIWLEYWQIHGMGHAWSGGSADGSYTDPNGPDVSERLLQFFFEDK